jgi:serine phosphatase RsbU (regulator of sigma subunit)
MHELWSSTSYEPHLLSLPFALAPVAILIAIAYAAVMRGEPVLRGFLLGHSGALLPYSVVLMLSPSIESPVLAEALFRTATAFIPLAGACAGGFMVALLGRYRRYRRVLWAAVASAVIWVYVGSATSATIDGVQWLSRLWYGDAGPWAWLALLHTAAMTGPAFCALGYVALTSPPSEERRQLRAAFVANGVTYAALIDATLAYGIGGFPVGGLLSGVGCLLVVRALIVEDLLRVRAVDTAAPLAVVYFATGALLAWVALAALDAPIPWPLTMLALVMCFAAVRVSVATVSLVSRGARGGAGPLDRLLAQLVDRARVLTAAPAIAQLAIDIVELGLGVRTRVLLASQEDWGFTTHTGDRLDDARAPDPLLASWLAERRGPVFAEDRDDVPAELRDLLAQLLASHDARAVIPVGSADELLGVLLLPAGSRPLRGPQLDFAVRAAERLAEALLHARLALRAAERAALAREVELAATVQAELLPRKGVHELGAITVVGSWRPATRCAGDFWTVMPLGPVREASGPGAPSGLDTPGGPDTPGTSDTPSTRDRPVLIAIGDVTGHGVASAMVTAAAIGACDVCVRRRGDALDLVELVTALDAAVRRVGSGGLAMTCFAAILDPARREIRFVSCGHPAPYLCRAVDKTDKTDKTDRTDEMTRTSERKKAGATHKTGEMSKLDKAIELHALAGRSNPLGSGAPVAPRVHHRTLEPGDLVVWYTDGVVEAQDPVGASFGDRRLQHLLRKLDRERLTPAAVHELVHRGVAAHRAGRPPTDDQTLVVAQIAQVARGAQQLQPADPGPAREEPP